MAKIFKGLKGNKGEWSEVYVLLKLLAELKLYSADDNLQSTGNYIDVLHILRNDYGTFKYLAIGDNINVIDAVTNRKILAVPQKKLSLIAKKLFNEIKVGSQSFAVSAPMELSLKELNINTLKAISSVKSDINIYLHDPSCGIKSLKKFSIKSFIGSDPTLFNANNTTNIVYEIKDVTGAPMPQTLIDSINSIATGHKYIKRVHEILQNGYSIVYSKYDNRTFKLNLELIDSNLPEILSFAVLEKYVNKITKMQNVIDNLELKNPLNYDNSLGHRFYEYRIVNLLLEASLGMTSASTWTGFHDVTGGVIIVKDNQEVLCYHLIEFNTFKSYLKANTRLDNPSGTKMGYGSIYTEEGKSFIKLNFQIKA